MNTSLFTNKTSGHYVPPADTTNAAGGVAYGLTPKAALAQLAVTGAFNNTFYTQAEEQLSVFLSLARQCDPDFVAKVAVYARTKGFMKDAPAVLVAHLASIGRLTDEVFGRVIDNGKMLRNFVQIFRSGVLGRKSLGTRPRRFVRRWLAARNANQLFRASVGASPSLADVIKLVHPKPHGPEVDELYAYLLGKGFQYDKLPDLVQAFERFKAGIDLNPPDVPHEMLTALPLSSYQWQVLAQQGGWHFVRMNLNTFARHGCFANPEFVDFVARKLADPEQVVRARVMPYQLMSAYMNVGPDVPVKVANALQDAMDVALINVPRLPSRPVVCVDVSGSMSGPVTGMRGSGTTKTRCVDVAALIASAIVRTNQEAAVILFSQHAGLLKLNPRDSVMTNARAITNMLGGGTDCSAPLRLLAQVGLSTDTVIMVSDNESWMRPTGWTMGATGAAAAWATFRQANPKAKLACIDITPNTSTQINTRPEVLNVGGFSDAVFSVLGAFFGGDTDSWVKMIEEGDSNS